MKKNVFSKSLRALIVTLLLLAVLFSRERSQKLMLAAIVAWLIFWAVRSIICSVIPWLRQNILLPRPRTGKKVAGTRKTKQVQTARSTDSGQQQNPAPFGEPELAQMLQHIRLRITDKLKSAYPDATWQWGKEPGLHSLLAGETFRILVENMADYTHADITFDRFGRIHVEPMTIGSFFPDGKPQGGPDESDTPDEPDTQEPPVVDARVWYELIGQKVLTDLITDLNAKGHSRLSISENGDVTVKNQKKDHLLTTLESFPAKNYWAELADILAEDQLTVKVTEGGLQVSWI